MKNTEPMPECDFCEKQAVGYTPYQIHAYCKDHEEIAVEGTIKILDKAEKDRGELNPEERG